MDKIIQKFYGHSGSSIYLMENEIRRYVLKRENIERNVERLSALQNVVNVPEIYEIDVDTLKMEYIHGLDMKTYLKFNNIHKIFNFITQSLEIFQKKQIMKDYTPIYEKALKWIDNENLPFTSRDLIEKLPKILPQSNYHGDMTLENIIYGVDDEFYFIDAVTTPYDSWIFDVAKLRQDLECKWFLRNDNIYLDNKLNDLWDKISNLYPETNNDCILIAMLLRVLIHCKKKSFEYNFIVNHLERLWK